MIRVYGFSLDSDWRFQENPDHSFTRRSPRLWGMDVRFSNKKEQDTFVELIQKLPIPRLDRLKTDENSCRLAITRESLDRLLKNNTGVLDTPFLNDLIKFKRAYFEPAPSPVLKIGGHHWDLSRQTVTMGILNVTPDSFSDGGKYTDVDHALSRAQELVSAGADILDIGGESSRPGAEPLPEKEERARVLPVLKAIRLEFSVPISVDTVKASVAGAALESGADMINDISGLRFDAKMARVVRDFDVPVVIMHIRGTPKNMQKNPVYKNLPGEILDFLDESRQMALQAGISRDKIIVDPGIGFGKLWFQNYQILGELAALKMLQSPILIGPSRKSFLGKVLNIAPDLRVEGTLVANAIGILNGANIIRVHDVKEAKKAAQIADMFAGKMAELQHQQPACVNI